MSVNAYSYIYERTESQARTGGLSVTVGFIVQMSFKMFFERLLCCNRKMLDDTFVCLLRNVQTLEKLNLNERLNQMIILRQNVMEKKSHLTYNHHLYVDQRLLVSVGFLRH